MANAKPILDTTNVAYQVLCRLADLCTVAYDDYQVLRESLRILQMLPVGGGSSWLRLPGQEMFSPSGSFLPPESSTSAIPEDHHLVQSLQAQPLVILEPAEAEPIILLPPDRALALAPIQHDEVVLGLLGLVGERTMLEQLAPVIIASSKILGALVANSWLRRQQREAEDVAETLFCLAGELRKKGDLQDILGMLSELSLRLFSCDWAGVYIWQEEIPDDTQEGEIAGFVPVQIVTRIGRQAVHDEPPLLLEENPALELLLDDPRLYSFRDLQEQPRAMPIYLERHTLRGVVLVPIQHESHLLGLLSIGYRTPLPPLSSRAVSLAQGFARMVAVALDRTLTHAAREPMGQAQQPVEGEV